jgi:hypothetical protein
VSSKPVASTRYQVFMGKKRIEEATNLFDATQALALAAQNLHPANYLNKFDRPVQPRQDGYLRVVFKSGRKVKILLGDAWELITHQERTNIQTAITLAVLRREDCFPKPSGIIPI